MATIKSFTSLEQSKKLSEILPLESADMCWTNHCYGVVRSSMTISAKTVDEYKSLLDRFNDSTSIDVFYPAWSLSALLSVLPFHLIVNNHSYAFSMVKGLDRNGETYAIKYTIFNTTFYLHLTDFYNNPIDACVAMIEKLHELNLL